MHCGSEVGNFWPLYALSVYCYVAGVYTAIYVYNVILGPVGVVWGFFNRSLGGFELTFFMLVGLLYL